MQRPTVLHQGEAFLHGEEESLYVCIEMKIKEFFSHGAKRGELRQTGLCRSTLP